MSAGLAASERPCVLIVAPYNPYPPYSGGPVRILGIAKALRNASIRTIVLSPTYTTLADANPAQEVAPAHHIRAGPRKRWAQFLNPWLITKGVQAARELGATHILAASFASGINAAAISFLSRRPLIFDEFNVEHERFRRMGRRRISFILRAYERALARLSTHVLCVSSEDENGLLAIGIPKQKLILVPNGFQEDEVAFNAEMAKATRRELGIEDGGKLVVFFGKMDYHPNREAARFIASVAAPRFRHSNPNVTFVVVGGNPPKDIAGHNVQATGSVPAMAPYLMAADVVYAPLQSGGGTKLKIVEALAHGKTVVTTTIGAEGLPSELTTLRICPTPEASISDLEQALAESRYDAPPNATNCNKIRTFAWNSTVRPLVRVLESA